MIKSIILAYERYRLAEEAWREASKGKVVILDRYKTEGIGVMDSKRLNPDIYRGIKRILALAENRLYDKMIKPHIIIHLKVPIEVALERNRLRNKKDKANDSIIVARHNINKNLSFSARSYIKLNSCEELSSVVLKVKQILWEIM